MSESSTQQNKSFLELFRTVYNQVHDLVFNQTLLNQNFLQFFVKQSMSEGF